MEVIKYIKKLFCEKNCISNQISVFSLVGIFVILFIKYTANWGNMLFYHNFFISVPSSRIEFWMYLFLGLLLVIYFCGYVFNVMHNVMNNKICIMPDVTLKPFWVFLKILPLGICWIGYYVGVCTGGVYLLSLLKNSAYYYLFASVMICIIPFIFVILAQFTFEFEYRKKFFNVLKIFRVLDKTLGEVIFLSLEVFLFTAIPLLLIYKVLAYPVGEDLLVLNLSVKLAALCIGAYIMFFFNLVYFAGLADIAKNKLND